jgi:hypothetical protein
VQVGMIVQPPAVGMQDRRHAQFGPEVLGVEPRANAPKLIDLYRINKQLNI